MPRIWGVDSDTYIDAPVMRPISHEHRTAKKEHLCTLCLKRIETGEVYCRRTRLEDDQLIIYKHHIHHLRGHK